MTSIYAGRGRLRTAAAVALAIGLGPVPAASFAGQGFVPLSGTDLGGTVVSELVIVEAGTRAVATRDLEVVADRIVVLGALDAVRGANITLRATGEIVVAGQVEAGDGVDGAVATVARKATPGANGGDLVLDAGTLTFGPAAVLASGSGGAGGAAAAVNAVGAKVSTAGAQGGKGGDVVLTGTTVAALRYVALGNGGAGGAAKAFAPADRPVKSVNARGGAGGDSGSLVVGGTAVRDALLAQRLQRAGVLAGGVGGAGGSAEANGDAAAAANLLPCTLAPICGATGTGGYKYTPWASNGANGVTGPTTGDPKDHAPGKNGGNAAAAYATGGTGGYGYLQGGEGGEASSTGGRGGNGGHGAHGYWPGHYNFPTCTSNCPAIAGGYGGRGGNGGYASAHGGTGGGSLVLGGNGGARNADGGDGGNGGHGGHGGAYGVFDWSNQDQFYGELIGCFLPLPGEPTWLCVMQAPFSLEYEPVCGDGGRGGARGAQGGANFSGGSGGAGLKAGTPGSGIATSGTPGLTGSTGAARNSWLINFMGETPNTNYCAGNTNPY